MIDLEAIRMRVAEKRGDGVFTDAFLDKGEMEWCAELWSDIAALLAEVERNTCACGHQFADHDLSTGAIVQCLMCKDDEGRDGRDCFEHDLRRESKS